MPVVPPSPAGPPGPEHSPRVVSPTLVRRLLPPLALALALLAAAFVFALLVIEERRVKRRLTEDAAAFRRQFERSLDLQGRAIATAVAPLELDEPVRHALVAQDRERLHALCRPLFETLRAEHRITHFYFHDPDRRNLIRFHDPDRRDDRIDRQTLREAERTGRPARGIELGPLGTFTLRAVIPVRANGRQRPLGYIEAGKEIEDLLRDLAADPDLRFALFVRKSHLFRRDWEAGMRMLGRTPDWDRFPDEVLAHASPRRDGSDGDIDLVAELARPETRTVSLPMADAAGVTPARLLLLRDTARARRETLEVARRLVGFSVPLLALLIGYVYVRLRRADRLLTERETALAENEARYRALFEHADNGVAIFEVVLNDAGEPRDLLLLEVNPAFERHTGLSPERVVGKTMAESHGGEPHPEALRIAGEVALRGRPVRFEWRGQLSGRDLDMFAYRVGPLRIALLFHDITAKKRDEESERARTEETRRLTALMLDRESRVLELKREVNELLARMNRDPKYGSVNGDEPR